MVFVGWLSRLAVRAITPLICISQLHLLSHPSVNQCAAKVSQRTIASLLLRLANNSHRNLLPLLLFVASYTCLRMQTPLSHLDK